MKRPNITCDRCGQPIGRWHDLVVWCDTGKADEVARIWNEDRKRREREAEAALKSGDMEAWCNAVTHTIADLAEPPHPVSWQVMHFDCISDAEWEWGYPIEGARINTLGKALAWTLHLEGKTWYEATDWEGLIRRLFTLPNP